VQVVQGGAQRGQHQTRKKYQRQRMLGTVRLTALAGMQAQQAPAAQQRKEQVAQYVPRAGQSQPVALAKAW
jgi:hypothetical protein